MIILLLLDINFYFEKLLNNSIISSNMSMSIKMNKILNGNDVNIMFS